MLANAKVGSGHLAGLEGQQQPTDGQDLPIVTAEMPSVPKVQVPAAPEQVPAWKLKEDARRAQALEASTPAGKHLSFPSVTPVTGLLAQV